MLLTKASTLTVLSTLSTFVVGNELSSLRGVKKNVAKKQQSKRRRLSVDLGNGNCELTPPVAEVPEDLDLWKTLVVGFPSGDKRMVYVQMGALTGLPAKDDWVRIMKKLFAPSTSICMCLTFIRNHNLGLCLQWLLEFTLYQDKLPASFWNLELGYRGRSSGSCCSVHSSLHGRIQRCDLVYVA